ncbi:DUF4863 family protein [Cocleimonas sp. KMM 6892]|uniref:4-hydroxylaminobenzoate lyase n=1 Tax=unclassified Cocleimonas TaxID=2639732 RepID=UPI002DB82707|nr:MULTISPECIES: DUF4863 family protein [unclassified Cocleimonas]MEB8432607.1 DUF4863 family protein [Cocleimonas sp. KMM 6892]MEC4715466.1 DUF4863 family protein [Cocleimonas sp. KMM 6895]MEC4744916.1 DUF4863 family protein [Cocleimonas sp. KMM 6896]
MSVADFQQQIASLTKQIQGRPIDTDLETWLNLEHGTDSHTYQQLKNQCKQGVTDGWLCQYEGAGIRYGRVFEPSDDIAGFSVDVVDMKDIAGPHHTHPNGEVNLIMPLEGNALFDNHSAGWKVHPPASSHKPTVTNGRALVLYLLPDGKIEFTR